jgi:glycosyltransferase involved in cell wall biosynthesis
MNQTVKLDEIVLVDDGSRDNTRGVGEKLGCTVISLPYHQENYVGRPELAIRVNVGLAYIRKNCVPDFVLQMGADHILPSDYVSTLLKRMRNKVAVASGRLKGEAWDQRAPLGSGRLVNATFWENATHLLYPVNWGWESWLLLKARMMGYEVRCYGDILTEGRPIRLPNEKAYYWGKGMFALGYPWPYAILRSLSKSLKSPKTGLSMFLGYMQHRGIERLDVTDYVRSLQRQIFRERVLSVL